MSKRTTSIVILLIALAAQGCAATLPEGGPSATPLADSTEAPTYDWQASADARRTQDDALQQMQDSQAASQATLAQEMQQSAAFDAQIQQQTQQSIEQYNQALTP